MHRFDYQFLADNLPANLLEIAGIIYDLRGKGEIRKIGGLLAALCCIFLNNRMMAYVEDHLYPKN